MAHALFRKSELLLLHTSPPHCSTFILFRERNLKKEDLDDETDDKKRKRPEDVIPDLPENQKAREFLKNAPTKGLWLPMGSEVKTMQCFRCKAYGHRSGDRECPLYEQGNVLLDSQRQVCEDKGRVVMELMSLIISLGQRGPHVGFRCYERRPSQRAKCSSFPFKADLERDQRHSEGVPEI
jgi:hypothetical protein